jgi:hypothetical protein
MSTTASTGDELKHFLHALFLGRLNLELEQLPFLSSLRDVLNTDNMGKPTLSQVLVVSLWCRHQVDFVVPRAPFRTISAQPNVFDTACRNIILTCFDPNEDVTGILEFVDMDALSKCFAHWSIASDCDIRSFSTTLGTNILRCLSFLQHTTNDLLLFWMLHMGATFLELDVAHDVQSSRFDQISQVLFRLSLKIAIFSNPLKSFFSERSWHMVKIFGRLVKDSSFMIPVEIDQQCCAHSNEQMSPLNDEYFANLSDLQKKLTTSKEHLTKALEAREKAELRIQQLDNILKQQQQQQQPALRSSHAATNSQSAPLSLANPSQATQSEYQRFIEDIASEYEAASLRNDSFAQQLSGCMRNLSHNLYSDPWHFVLELLQNIEDACVGGTRSCQVSMRIIACTGESVAGECVPIIEISSNQPCLNENQIRSMCQISNSSKLSDDCIGHKGVGFKSVFAVSDFPHFAMRLPECRDPIWFHFAAPPPDVSAGHETNNLKYLGYCVPKWGFAEGFNHLNELFSVDERTVSFFFPVKAGFDWKSLTEKSPQHNMPFLESTMLLNFRAISKFQIISRQSSEEQVLLSMEHVKTTLLSLEEKSLPIDAAATVEISETSIFKSQDGKATQTKQLYDLFWRSVGSSRLSYRDRICVGIPHEPCKLPVCATFPLHQCPRFPFMLQGDWLLVTSRSDLQNGVGSSRNEIIRGHLTDMIPACVQMFKQTQCPNSDYFTAQLIAEPLVPYFWKSLVEHCNRVLVETLDVQRVLLVDDPNLHLKSVAEKLWPSCTIYLSSSNEARAIASVKHLNKISVQLILSDLRVNPQRQYAGDMLFLLQHLVSHAVKNSLDARIVVQCIATMFNLPNDAIHSYICVDQSTTLAHVDGLGVINCSSEVLELLSPLILNALSITPLQMNLNMALLLVHAFRNMDGCEPEPRWFRYLKGCSNVVSVVIPDPDNFKLRVDKHFYAPKSIIVLENPSQFEQFQQELAELEFCILPSDICSDRLFSQVHWHLKRIGADTEHTVCELLKNIARRHPSFDDENPLQNLIFGLYHRLDLGSSQFDCSFSDLPLLCFDLSNRLVLQSFDRENPLFHSLPNNFLCPRRPHEKLMQLRHLCNLLENAGVLVNANLCRIEIEISEIEISNVSDDVNVPVHWVKSVQILNSNKAPLPQLRGCLYPFFFVRNLDDLNVSVFGFRPEAEGSAAAAAGIGQQCAQILPNVNSFRALEVTDGPVVFNAGFNRIDVPVIPSDLMPASVFLNRRSPVNYMQQIENGRAAEETLNRYFHSALRSYLQDYWKSSFNPRPPVDSSDKLGFDFQLQGTSLVRYFFELFGPSIVDELQSLYPSATRVCIECKYFNEGGSFFMSPNERRVSGLQVADPYVVILARPTDATDTRDAYSFLAIFLNLPDSNFSSSALNVQTVRFPFPPPSTFNPMVLKLEPSAWDCKLQSPAAPAPTPAPSKLIKCVERGCPCVASRPRLFC